MVDLVHAPSLHLSTTLSTQLPIQLNPPYLHSTTYQSLHPYILLSITSSFQPSIHKSLYLFIHQYLNSYIHSSLLFSFHQRQTPDQSSTSPTLIFSINHRLDLSLHLTSPFKHPSIHPPITTFLHLTTPKSSHPYLEFSNPNLPHFSSYP